MGKPILPIHLASFQLRAPDDAGEEVEVRNLSVLRLDLTETISEPYELDILVASADEVLPVPSPVGGRCELRIGRGEFVRSIHGIVINAETLGVRQGRLLFRLFIAPSLKILSLSRRRRVFTGLTAVEIVQQVLSAVHERYGGELDLEQLEHVQLRVRDYCVQYDETDLDFVQRLLAEEGIAFAFKHEGATETMVLLPMTAILHSAAGEHEIKPRELRVRSKASVSLEETIHWFRGVAGMRARQGEWAMRNWKLQRPKTVYGREDRFEEDVDLGDAPSRHGEVYEFETYRPVEEREGGPLFEQVDGEVRVLANRARIEDARARGASNVLGLTEGATFELTDHSTRELDGYYAVLRVYHVADFGGGTTDENPLATEYWNRFDAFRFGNAENDIRHTYAPPRPKKPRVVGSELATVVGPEGEEIHTDPFGRIKVRLHWDREGLALQEHETSCWVPVRQLSAGPGYGAVFLPRVGMEVVIDFIGGDPDRPVCGGVVYNGQNQPPYTLPGHRTRSVLRTATTPTTGGYNELSFEDAKGSEEIHLHAQRNLREVVRAAHTTSVGGSCSVSIGKDHKRIVGGAEEIHIGEFGKGQSTSQQFFVAGSQDHYIEELHAVKAKGAFWEFDEGLNATARERTWLSCVPGAAAYDRRPSGGSLVELTPACAAVEAPEKIELAVGDTKIVITDGKIELQSAVIQLASAGATLEMDTLIEMSGAEVNASGGATSHLRLRGGSAELEGVSAKVTSDQATTVDSAGSCVITASETTVEGEATVVVKGPHVAVEGTNIAVEGTKIATVATGDHVIRGKPIRIN